jgi:hypothetical protein
MDAGNDHLERRCPGLGGIVPFKYCRESGDEGQPCWKVFDCWWERFDIQEYLRLNLSEEGFNRLIESKPAPKITSLIELIEQAKARIT